MADKVIAKWIAHIVWFITKEFNHLSNIVTYGDPQFSLAPLIKQIEEGHVQED